MANNAQFSAFWSESETEVLTQLNSSAEGITQVEAEKRLLTYGYNRIRKVVDTSSLRLFLVQFKSPLLLILIAASLISFFIGDKINTYLILGIVFMSSFLGFWQEKGATDAVKKLLLLVQVKATVLRDGTQTDIPHDDIVPGDVVILNAGDIIPADCLLLESNVLSVNEASLTGETYPVEKLPARLPVETALSQRNNALYMGTNVISGTGKAVVVLSGIKTEFGKISDKLSQSQPETDFQAGIRQFSSLILIVTLLLTLVIFFFNVYLSRPVLQSFLFAVALAVGLAPELLPAIISINLAKGARKMVSYQVIVKKLASILSLGSMNVLCSDKTGTLTVGTVTVKNTVDFEGTASDQVFELAYLNAFFQSGFNNPIDEAIKSFKTRT